MINLYESSKKMESYSKSLYESSKKIESYSKALFWVTLALVFLTAVLAIRTFLP